MIARGAPRERTAEDSSSYATIAPAVSVRCSLRRRGRLPDDRLDEAQHGGLALGPRAAKVAPVQLPHVEVGGGVLATRARTTARGLSACAARACMIRALSASAAATNTWSLLPKRRRTVCRVTSARPAIASRVISPDRGRGTARPPRRGCGAASPRRRPRARPCGRSASPISHERCEHELQPGATGRAPAISRRPDAVSGRPRAAGGRRRPGSSAGRPGGPRWRRRRRWTTGARASRAPW